MAKVSNRTDIEVRFNEADPLGIVWHGHYIRYFEDGREAFGKEHQIRYLDFFKEGFYIPIVKVQCDYKKVLRYGDIITVETTFVSSISAKLKFEYRVFNKETGELVATGSTMQVFLDAKTNVLQLNYPDFFIFHLDRIFGKDKWME